jgi:uncharacterized low-complexity protein
MASNKTSLTIALGSAFAASLAMAPAAHSGENPFAMRSLDKGYMVADATEKTDGKMKGDKKSTAKKKKMKDGKCSEGKCSSNKMNDGKMKDDKAKPDGAEKPETKTM